MTLFDRALAKIERNWKKEYNCIPFSSVMPRFSEYLPGISQNTYYLVTANAKVGKTQFTDAFFLYHAYDFIKSVPESGVSLKVFYNSLELDLETKIVQGIVRKLFLDYGMYVPHKDILSISRNRMSEELFQKIRELRGYFEEFEDIVEMSDDQLDPEAIYNRVAAYAEDNGTTVTKKIRSFDPIRRVEREVDTFDRYIPNDPNRYTLIITDHRLMWLR